MRAFAAFAGQQLDRVGQHREKHLERFPDRARRAGQVHDERRADRARDAARQHPVRRLLERPRAKRFRDARHLAVDHATRRFGCDVVWRQAGPSGREHHVGTGADRPEDRGRDPFAVVRHERFEHHLATRAEQPITYRGTALVDALARGALRAHRDDAGADCHLLR